MLCSHPSSFKSTYVVNVRRKESNVQQFKIIIEWFPFWQLVGLAALNVLVGGLCMAGLVFVLASMVP